MGRLRSQGTLWRDRFCAPRSASASLPGQTGPLFAACLPDRRFFRDLSENQLRRAVFRSVPELVCTIEQYVEKHNRQPKPFIWTAKASDILAKVTRARAKLNKMQSV
jgi:hypothetical protein